MKENKGLTFMISAGVFVLIIFTAVIVYNLMPQNNESNSYYVKVEDEMSAKVEALEIQNSKLNITTSGDAIKYCVKSTKSIPDEKSICWKEITDNTATISIYEYKKYYVWIMDANGKVSSSMSINTKSEK